MFNTPAFLLDARHFQILYLGLFLAYGLFGLTWAFEWQKYALIFTACLFVQLLGIAATGIGLQSLKSALITALGLCLLFKSSSVETLALGAGLAIASKFIIRYKGTHFFNPANFGIIAAILLTGDAWISPGQWGSSMVLLYFFGAAALIVLLKVGRIDTSLAFLVTFAALEYVRTVLFLGWEFDVFAHKMLNGSLLLFTFFMITDPKTTPRAPAMRILWAVLIGIITFILSNWMYVHTAPMWALFFISPLTVLFNMWVKGKEFKWITPSKITVP
jgi:Na+-transporting NADH:ubiquinone oxidoreductase subunit NqrB